MVYLADIVGQINETLNKRLSKYTRADYAGIATLAYVPMEEGKTVVFPSVINLSGSKVEEIRYDNKVPFSIYHRLLSSSYSQGTQKGYADGDIRNVKISTALKLVCVGNRRDINVFPEQLAMIIADSFPTGASAERIKYITITPSGITFDAQTVFNTEFKNVEFNIGPERFLFSVQYTIEGGYIQGCLKNCDC